VSFQETITDGSLVLALPLALAAGLVSFLSPCVLPLVPGYLSYVTGLSAAEVFDEAAQRRGRLLLGALLFVTGFTVVFVSAGVLLGGFGGLPWLQRDLRVRSKPAVGLAGAPMLGVLFGLGWTPCIGPTLGAVMALGIDSGTAARGGILAVAYCLGLGLPFVVTALAFGRAMSAFAWVKRHHVWVMRAGGAMLVTIGILLVTGVWNDMTVALQVWVNGFTPAV
jgi:cytochrome c-type biogenesis protein